MYPEKNVIMISMGFPIQSTQAFNCARDCLALFPDNNFKGGLTLTDRGLDVIEIILEFPMVVLGMSRMKLETGRERSVEFKR